MSKWLASLLLGIVLLAGATGLAWAQRTAAATVAGRPPAMPAHPDPALGVNVALEHTDALQRAETLDAIAAAGFGWVRQRFPWDQIEPSPGVYDWALWDEIVATAAARGLELVAVLDGSPAWARSVEDAANPLAPPSSRADFGRFAAAFAGRYGEQLRFYQVWDEPNIAPHWGNRYVDAADYAGLLREAAVQLRSADPNALILLAALAPTVEPGGLNQSDLAFLDALYAAEAAPWFDAVAAQPYGFDRPPDDPPVADTLNFRRVELLRQVMLRRDAAGTPIWLTAFGWHSAAGDGDSPWRSVAPDVQAAWAVDALEWARRQWDWTTGLAWAVWQPPQPLSDPRWGFALVTPDGEASLTLDALSSWAQTLHPLGPGAWLLNAPAVQAEDGWRLLSQAADPPHGAALGNNYLRIPFEGTTLALDVQRGPYWGYLDVAVDGQPANALPRDAAGRANLLLHDPLGQQATVVVARDLSAGPHVAEISATGGWEQWPLLAVRVANEPPPRWPGWLVWALGLSGTALVGAGIAGIRRQPVPERTTEDASPSIFDGAERVPTTARYVLLAGLAVVITLGPPPIQLVALGLLFALFVVWPATGLALAAATAPLFLVLVPILGRPLSPAEATIWLLAAALATRALVEFALWRYVKKGAAPGWIAPGRLQALDWAVLTLLAVAVVSLAATDNLGVALRELRTVIVAGVLAYWLVRLAPAGRDGRFDPWPVVWGIGVGAAAVAGWGVYQAVGGVGLIGAEGVWRVRGPYGSPNNLALYLVHALPIVLAVAVFGVQRGRRLAAGMLAALIFVGLALTFSKGALLLGLPAAVLLMGFVAGGRWRWVALGLLAIGGLALLPLFGTERFAGLFDLQGGTSFFRVQLWRGAWNMALDHPWLGVGLDNFLYAYRTHYALPTAWQELSLSHPHNIVLDFWTRLGFLGLIVGVWLFTAAFWQGGQALKRASGDRWALLLGLLASLAATLAHGLIDNSLFLVDLMLLFMLSIGLIGRLGQELRGI
ncbi:MAG TPA: O-antigen ligase family protein [Anaerolineae bacterium]|nr:O-antigen ligase family protein [Anaerolineae bacterium]